MNKTLSPFTALLKACFAVATALAAGASAAAVPQQGSDGSIPVAASQTDRLIIKYRDSGPKRKGVEVPPPMTDARQEPAQRVGRQFGLSMRAAHAIGTGAYVFQLNRHVSLSEARTIAERIAATDPNVEYVEPDQLLQPMFTPNDPRYAEQWGYYETSGGIRLPAAWDKATGTGITVAVIDTGYRPHADMTGKFLTGYDFISSTTIANDGDGRDANASDPGDAVRAGECATGIPQQDRPSSWHGTHVAGTIAANTNNSGGVAGVAFNATILPARALGKCGGYTSDIADAIIWSSGGSVTGVPANANRARVINMSLGGGGTCAATTQSAINSARSRGTVVVVAAGNENQNAGNVNPANCTGVITVAAVNRAGGHAWYSNFGTVVDVAAPGGDTSVTANGILSTLNAGATAPGADSYAFYQGTSMATPHVAGVVALMLSKNAALTPDEVESRLKGSARGFPATCSGCGTGIVDASAAIDATTGDASTTIAETEPNGSQAAANTITNRNTLINAVIGSSSDADFFKVQLPAGATLSALMTPCTASADYDLFLYNSSGRLIGRSENGAGTIDSVSATNTGSGAATYFVRVVYYSGGTGSVNGKYTLKVAW